MARSKSRAGLSVVLVEDSPEDLASMRTWLERSGRYSVVATAGDGETGLELCRELQPDIVLIDISLPVMDGLHTLPLLRETCPDTTCIVVSGFSVASMKQRALDAGAHGYMEKARPIWVQRAELEAVVANNRGHLPEVPTDDGTATRARVGERPRVPFQRRDPRSAPSVPGVALT